MSPKASVLVAMSGGVDSSVAAAILSQQGFSVTGGMLRLWSMPGKEEENSCCTPDAMALARRVAARIDIPFYAFDAQEDFRKIVVEAFINGYKEGLTPNPCFICNQKFRWNFLIRQADALGADFIATGHYAQICEGAGGKLLLKRGIDESKDQSYMLAGLRQEQLARTILPLGGYLKKDIRKIAKNMDLAVAERPDSQDLCFLGDTDYRQFLDEYVPEVKLPGNIINRDGMKFGEHQGLAYYTIGQRKGLGIAAKQPYYVIEKDILHNVLIVGEKNELGQREARISDINWISGVPLRQGLEGQVKIRYKANFAHASIIPIDNKTVRLVFSDILRDITPGQIAVLYNGDEVLGGGVIQ